MNKINTTGSTKKYWTLIKIEWKKKPKIHLGVVFKQSYFFAAPLFFTLFWMKRNAANVEFVDLFSFKREN